MNTGNKVFRLSRVSHPRATLWAMLLLALVFLGFGLVAEAFVPAATLSMAGGLDVPGGESVLNILTALIPCH